MKARVFYSIAVGLVCLGLSAVSAAPANDDFANRIEIASSVFLVSASMAGATVEFDEPEAQTYGGWWQGTKQSVWWTWTAPGDGTLTVDASASSIADKAITVFQGGSLTTLTNILSAMRDDPLTFNVGAGQNYHIAALTDALQDGDMYLRFRFDPAPAHDNFADRAFVTGKQFSFSGTVRGATDETGYPQVHDIWCEWTAPVSGRVRIHEAPGIGTQMLKEATPGNLELFWPPPYEVDAGEKIIFRVFGSPEVNGELFHGEVDTTHVVLEPAIVISPGTTTVKLIQDPDFPAPTNIFVLETNITAAPWQVTFQPNAGMSALRVRVDYAGPRQEEFIITPQVRAPNDQFADATILPAGGATNSLDTLLVATRELGEPNHATSGNGGSLWWRWTAPADGYLFLQAYNAASAVYSGSTVDALVRLQPITAQPNLFAVQNGVTYSIAIQNQSQFYQGYSLITRFTAPLANDAFEDAQVLPVNGALIGDLNGAMPEPTGPDRTASVWYEWTAPGRGHVDIKLIKSAEIVGGFRRSDMTLKVFTGTTFDNLVRAPSETSSDVAFAKTVNAGDHLFIRVGSYFAGSVSDVVQFLIKTDFEAAPPNDLFADRTVIQSIPFTASYNSRFTSYEPDEQLVSGLYYTAWWEWTAPNNGLVSISPTSGSLSEGPTVKPQALVKVFQGDSLTTLQPVIVETNVHGEVKLNAIAGQNYKITVCANYSVDIDFLLSGPMPNNDFADAIVLTNQSVRTNFTILGATFEPGENTNIVLNGGTYPTVGNLWWRFDAPSNGYLKNVGAVLWPLTGASRDTLSPVPVYFADFNDYDGPSFTWSPLQQGQPYYFDMRKIYAPPRPPPSELAHFLSCDFATYQLLGLQDGAIVDVGSDPVVTLAAPNPLYDGTLVSPAALRLWPLDVWGGSTPPIMITNYPFTHALTNLVPGNYLLYAIGVTTNGDTLQTPQIHFAVRSTNDFFAQRRAMETYDGGVLAGTTLEPGEAALFSNDVTGSLWFEWVAPATEKVRLDAFASPDPGRAAVFTGLGIDSLQLVTQGSGALVFSATARVAYKIALLATSNARPFATMGITRAPTNDFFANASAMDVGPGYQLLSVDARLLSTEPGEALDASNLGTAWWKWTPYYASTVMMSGTLAGWELYRGESLTTLEKIDFASDTPAFVDLAPGTYYFRVSRLSENEIGKGLDVTITPRLPNDNFANATPVTGDFREYILWPSATREANEPFSEGGTVWWRWSPSITAHVNASVNSGWGLELFTGTDIASLQSVAPLRVSAPFYTWDVNAAESYYVRVTFPASTVGGNVSFTQPTIWPLPNDQFADRAVITGTSFHASGTTAGSTIEPAETESLGSLWWSWKPPRAGLARFLVSDSTLFRVWRGNDLANLTTASGGSATIPVAAGEEIQMSVNRLDAASFDWSLQFLDPAPNRTPETALRLIAPGTFDADFTKTQGWPLQQFLYWKWTAPMGGQVSLQKTVADEDLGFWFVGEISTTIHAIAGRTYDIMGYGNKATQFTLAFAPTPIDVEVGFQKESNSLQLLLRGPAETMLMLESSDNLFDWTPAGTILLNGDSIHPLPVALEKPATFIRTTPLN